ncbi:MAG: hypothetical protein GY949_01720, partial [Gammaproteobacteria bacterium]|nr:hypothetical protein [Gammaproteobacteria bacterium]
MDENGIDDNNAIGSGILSGVTTLTPGTESTTDGDTDANSDRTIDFGFVEYDWGDLPDTPYPTLLVTNGARHALDGRTYLGAGVDAEFDGQPDANAGSVALSSGDDGDGSDDEDGVVFDTPLMPNQPYQITVTGTPGSILNAWIDFDNDGTLETQVASNVTIPASGIYTINDTAPATVGASVYSRFRVVADAADGGNTPIGVAQSGEVEDYVLMSLGDTLWWDNGAGSGTGSNGVQDGTEPGLVGVTVELIDDATSTVIATTTTGAGGAYLFTGLPEGDYVVRVPANQFQINGPLEGYVSSPGGPDADTTEVDRDDNGVNPPLVADYLTDGVSTQPVTLTIGGEPDTGVDGNGPLSNLTVDLGFVQYDYGDVPDTYGTTNGADGARHLLDGTTYLGGRVDSENDGQPSVNADADDTNHNPAASSDDEDGITFLTPILPGQEFRIEVTAQTAAGTGYLNAWVDFDGNGTFETGERLAIGADTEHALSNGTTTLTFTAPGLTTDPPFPTTLYSRFRFTPDAGAATSSTTLATDTPPLGEVEDYALMSLGDRVWRDNGGTTGIGNNGIQDGDEAGIAGVVVELLDSTGTVITDQGGNPLTATTDTNGDYLFTGLQPGDYQVRIADDNFQGSGVLEGLFSSWDRPGFGDAQVQNDQGIDENGIDNPNPSANGITSGVTTLVQGGESTSDGDTDANSDRTIDFGFIEYDYGDLPDTPYPTLLATSGARHALDGLTYLGTGVDADINGQPHVSAGSVTAATGDDGDGSDDEDGVVFVTPLSAGLPYEIQVNAGPNAGVLNAWIDWNGNGTLEAGERLGTQDQAIAGGSFVTLTGTAPGTLPTSLYSRFRFTAAAGQGADTPTGPAETGEVEDYVLMSLGDRVWRDNGDGSGTGNNGIQDGGESGIENVVVELLDSTGTPVEDQAGNAITTLTDSNGDYLFTGLPEGQYQVRIAASNFQTNGELEGMLSSLDRAGFGDAEVQNDQGVDENGIDDNNAIGSGILSGVTTLTPGTESTTDGDTDANSDR